MLPFTEKGKSWRCAGVLREGIKVSACLDLPSKLSKDIQVEGQGGSWIYIRLEFRREEVFKPWGWGNPLGTDCGQRRE